MKIGEIQHDIDIKSGTGRCILGIYNQRTMINEGKNRIKKHPQYKYLENDPTLDKSSNDDFLKSVVYAYMKDEILKLNQNFISEYKKCIKEYIGNPDVIKQIGEPYSLENVQFLLWYQDYLREQANPGILNREKEAMVAKEKEINEEWKQQKLKNEITKTMKKIQEQQDLASGKRVVCPYCNSTNTEKISTVSRAVSVSLVGAASSKIGKQWHCKQCNSNF